MVVGGCELRKNAFLTESDGDIMFLPKTSMQVRKDFIYWSLVISSCSDHHTSQAPTSL